MQLARVVGNVVATMKDSTLEGRKLLVVQPIGPSGAAAGAPLVAIDGIGVGPGETVMFVKGREAAFMFLPDSVVADASIVGKVDSVDLRDQGERAGALSGRAARSAKRRAEHRGGAR